MIPWNKDLKGAQVAWNKDSWKRASALCCVCGDTFDRKRTEAMGYFLTRRYCSQVCSGKDTGFKKGSVSWSRGTRGVVIGWAKGKTFSDEYKKRLSLAHIGKTGELSGNWKGGITTADKLQRGKFRRDIQKMVFERDDYTCQMCGVRGKDMQVDHIQSWAEYVELRFKMENCRTLCSDCHYKITFGKPMPPTVRAWGHNLKGRVSP